MSTKKPMAELTCVNALEIVSASFDGEASPSEIDALASHLVGCPECRRAAESLETDDDLLRRFGRRSMVGDAATEPLPPASRWLPWAAAAALVLAALGALMLASFRRGPATPSLATHHEPVVSSGPVAREDLEAELDRLTAQAETLIARLDTTSRALTRQKGNPFRDRRSKNPFADSRFDPTWRSP